MTNVSDAFTQTALSPTTSTPIPEAAKMDITRFPLIGARRVPKGFLSAPAQLLNDADIGGAALAAKLLV